MDISMGFSAKRVALGLFVNVEIWTMLGCNLFCLWCIRRGRLYALKDNPVYAISFFNLLAETIQLILHAVYVGPAIISGDWIFSSQSSLGVTIASTLFLGLWYLGSLIQMLMALNRLFVVFAPGRAILSLRRLFVIVPALSLIALCLVVYSQLLSPCCRITPDPRFYAYSYLVFENQTDNLSMKFVDLPLDSFSSIICVASYVSLFYYVYRMGKGSHTSFKKKELRLCFQFLLMFLTYTTTWGTFFIFPYFGIQIAEAYIATTVIFMANCGVNSIIYLIMNKEIQSEARRILGKEEKPRAGPNSIAPSSTFKFANAVK